MTSSIAFPFSKLQIGMQYTFKTLEDITDETSIVTFTGTLENIVDNSVEDKSVVRDATWVCLNFSEVSSLEVPECFDYFEITVYNKDYFIIYKN